MALPLPWTLEGLATLDQSTAAMEEGETAEGKQYILF